MPLRELIPHRDLNLKLTLATLTFAHAIELLATDGEDRGAVPAIAISTTVQPLQLEPEVLDVLIALAIVADDAGFGHLARIVLILLEEDLSTHRLRAAAAASANVLLNPIGVVNKQLAVLLLRPRDVERRVVAEARLPFLEIVPHLSIHGLELCREEVVEAHASSLMICYQH